LSKKAALQVGGQRIKWKDFADAVLLLEERSEDIMRPLNSHGLQNEDAKPGYQIEICAPGAQNLVETLNHLFRKSKRGDLERLVSIETLVYTLSSYDVGLARDAIYSLLQLGKDTCTDDTHTLVPEEEIQIDYNISTREVYVDFIEKVIKKSSSLDIICMPWAPPPNETHRPSLPSWIVSIGRQAYDKPYDDPTYYLRVNADSLIGRVGTKTYSTTGRVPMFPTPEILGKAGRRLDPLRLKAKGRVIGEIKELGYCATDSRIHFNQLDMAVKSAERPDVDSEGESEAGEYIPEAFWRTLVADRGPRGAGPPGWYRRACQKCFNRPPKDHKLNTEKEIQDAMINSNGHSINRPLVQFLRRVQAATWNRRFMITVGGKFGLVPAEAERGDRLCLLWGCTVPVVLRQQSDYWILVGECYIHGIMNEKLLEKNPELPRGADTPGDIIGNKTFEII
jgi:hypothetical protein